MVRASKIRTAYLIGAKKRNLGGYQMIRLPVPRFRKRDVSLPVFVPIAIRGRSHSPEFAPRLESTQLTQFSKVSIVAVLTFCVGTLLFAWVSSDRTVTDVASLRKATSADSAKGRVESDVTYPVIRTVSQTEPFSLPDYHSLPSDLEYLASELGSSSTSFFELFFSDSGKETFADSNSQISSQPPSPATTGDGGQTVSCGSGPASNETASSATCANGTCNDPNSLGTALVWADSPQKAADLAEEQGKLVYLIQVSGNFAREEFT